MAIAKKKAHPKKVAKKNKSKHLPPKGGGPFGNQGDTSAPLDPDNLPWTPPKGTEPPVGSPMPAELLARLEDAVRFRNDPVKAAGARSQQIRNEPYNRQMFERYATARKTWWNTYNAAGERPYQEPPSPVPYYYVSDFQTLYALAQADIPVPYQQQEINYNQMSYPAQPRPIDWYSLVEPAIERLTNG